MALRAPLPPTHQVDQMIGFTGFFVVVFFAVTVYCELTGQPALGWALTLLVVVVVLLLLWRRRVAIVRRARAAMEAAAEAESAPASGRAG